MKEAIVTKGPKVTIKDTPIPEVKPNHVVIKVEVSGSNPKDWKIPEWMNVDMNSGDDIAGTVHEVGQGAEVYGFRKGDRVAAFHEMRTPGGSFAEYAIAPAWTTFRLPDKTSYEEGAALPLAVLTAAVGLYARLGLPQPWTPAQEDIPLVVYGGASAVGAYAIKYAQRSNIHPIIAIAGRGIPFVESLIDKSKGDIIVDYRKGDEAVVQGIKDALKGKKLNYAFDAVSEKGSFQNITKVLDPHGHITLVLPGADYSDIPDTVHQTLTSVGSVHQEGEGKPWNGIKQVDNRALGYVFSQDLTRGLNDGYLTPHPHEVVPGGLEGVEKGLSNLKDGKASAIKYVFRIADTPGL